MTARKESSSFDEQSDHESGRRALRAPIRQTMADEIEGLFRFAAARLGNNTDMAEDAVQQALLIAMAHAAPPAEVPVQRAWLRGIVQNVIRRQFRTLRRGRAAIARVAIEQHALQAGRDDHTVARHDEFRSRTVQALYLAVTELHREDQDLFYAFYRAGRSHACIAADLGTTCKGVEARLYRLRTRLRTALKRTGEHLP